MKFTWKKAAAFAAMAALTVSFAGCGGGDKKADDKKAAKGNDKELVMYMGIVEQAAKVVAAEFEKDTGIKVKFVRMSGGETLSRIRAEKNNPQASLWYGGKKRRPAGSLQIPQCGKDQSRIQGSGRLLDRHLPGLSGLHSGRPLV